MSSVNKIHLKLIFLFFLFLGPFTLCGELYDPLAVYLTLQQHPESAMTIHWITPSSKTDDTVLFRKEGTEKWLSAKATSAPLPEGHDEFTLHTIELTELEPATAYQFRPGEQAVSFKFQTLPATLNEPIRFIAGGDMYHDFLNVLETTSQQAAKTDPRFALIGGDLAYASPKDPTQPENMQRWLDFVVSWKKTMVTSKGYLIPIIASTSNEDTKGRYEQTPEQAQFFYAFFTTPDRQGYRVVDFSNYLSVWVLDTGHTHPIQGEQEMWLEDTLSKRKNVPTKLALYHVPAYPSVRNYHLGVCPLVRLYWVPLFEKHGIQVAFEHHDHAYKRSFPIRCNHIDPLGVTYIGDGGWGVQNPRAPKTQEQRWYIAKSAAKRNFIAGTLYPDHTISLKAMDENGDVFDEVTLQSVNSEKK